MSRASPVSPTRSGHHRPRSRSAMIRVTPSISLPEDVRARLERLAGSRLTRDGVLVIDAHRHRTQARNRQDARARLIELIRRAAVAPRPRRATKPTAASRERRLDSKKRRAAIKGLRQGKPALD